MELLRTPWVKPENGIVRAIIFDLAAAATAGNDAAYLQSWEDLIAALETGETMPRLQGYLAKYLYPYRRTSAETWHLQTDMLMPSQYEVVKYVRDNRAAAWRVMGR